MKSSPSLNAWICTSLNNVQNVRIRCDCFATELSIEGLCVGIGNIRILFRLATDKERRDVFVRMSVMFIHPWFSCVVHIVYPLECEKSARWRIYHGSWSKCCRSNTFHFDSFFHISSAESSAWCTKLASLFTVLIHLRAITKSFFLCHSHLFRCPLVVAGNFSTWII